MPLLSEAGGWVLPGSPVLPFSWEKSLVGAAGGARVQPRLFLSCPQVVTTERVAVEPFDPFGEVRLAALGTVALRCLAIAHIAASVHLGQQDDDDDDDDADNDLEDVNAVRHPGVARRRVLFCPCTHIGLIPPALAQVVRQASKPAVQELCRVEGEGLPVIVFPGMVVVYKAGTALRLGGPKARGRRALRRRTTALKPLWLRPCPALARFPCPRTASLPGAAFPQGAPFFSAIAVGQRRLPSCHAGES
jgi:hypothetical protein